MEVNDITYKIRGCIFKVYNTLGPGLLESVYEAALMHEFQKKGIRALNQHTLPVLYDDVVLEIGFRIDILVEDTIIIELKSVEEFSKVHYKQLLTNLKLANKEIGILVNFNSDDINENTKRIINNYYQNE
jgi:GxxExxY protein